MPLAGIQCGVRLGPWKTTPFHTYLLRSSPGGARVLFWILMMAIFGPEPPSAKEVLAELERIWNAEQLGPEDFRDTARMDQVFDKYAAKHWEKVWWLDGVGISRQDAERVGYFPSRRRSIHSRTQHRQERRPE